MTEPRIFRPTPAHVAIGFFIALFLFGAANAAPTPLAAANKANDVVALETLAKSAATPDARAVARGAALALRHKDAAALAVLEPLAQGHAANDLRDEAWSSLAGIYLRQGRFADVVKAADAAKALRAGPLTHEEEQTADFARSLSGVTPMAVAHKAAGSVPVKRDIAGLMRIDVAVNGNPIDAIVDSGAGFSTLSESAAKKFGVRVIDRVTSVGSASRDDLKTRVGVADKLQVGDAVLSNVVVAVLPDSDLTFADGRYKIDAIVGLPVFEALERIELKQADGKEALYYGAKPGTRATGNLILAGVEPIVLGEGASPLRMFIDTGATHTSLNASAGRDFPALTAGAVKNSASSTGAGGTTTDPDAMTIPTLPLSIAGRTFTLSGVVMHSKTEPGRHGAIGQDVLKQGSGWYFDFDTMSFAVEN